MLIPFKKIINTYKIKPKGILHIGAHTGEEADSYHNMGIDNVIWVEADPKTFDKLKTNLNRFENQKCYCFAACDKDDNELDFYVANNGESSSILEMDSHLLNHPDVKVTEKKTVKTKTIDSFLKQENINTQNYNFLNLDIQGAELLALKGMTNYLEKVDYIYSEVNSGEVYKNCAKINEIDKFLYKFGFIRVETVMTKFEWGDAFYIKK